MEAENVFDDPLARIFKDTRHVQPQEGSGKTMKKILAAKTRERPVRELAPEYRFDYANAKPNRFAGPKRTASVAVLLDPDVAKVFESGEAVNSVLRALITTMRAFRRSSRSD